MPTKAFLSCHSITKDLHATDSYMEDVELKRRALDISAETFLLADASKLNHPGVIKVASSVEFDILSPTRRLRHSLSMTKGKRL